VTLDPLLRKYLPNKIKGSVELQLFCHKSTEIVIEFFQDFESKRMDRIGERFRSEIQLMEEGKGVNKNMKEFMSKIVEMIETQNQK
jgi:hypothetical protein